MALPLVLSPMVPRGGEGVRCASSAAAPPPSWKVLWMVCDIELWTCIYISSIYIELWTCMADGGGGMGGFGGG